MVASDPSLIGGRILFIGMEDGDEQRAREKQEPQMTLCYIWGL